MLAVFDDMIADAECNKRLSPKVTGRKLNISLVFISHSYFKVPKTIRPNAIHYFIMKIPKIPYIKYVKEGRQRAFLGVMKYFSHILMAHELFFKIFDGSQYIFLCSIFLIFFSFKLRGSEHKMSKVAIMNI